MPRLHTASAFLTAFFRDCVASHVLPRSKRRPERFEPGARQLPPGGERRRSALDRFEAFQRVFEARRGGARSTVPTGTCPGRGFPTGGFGGNFPTEASGGATAGPEGYSPRSGSLEERTYEVRSVRIESQTRVKPRHL